MQEKPSHHLLDHIPRRHQLVTLGDFNTQCVPSGGQPTTCPHGVSHRQGHSPPERLPANAEHPSRSPPSGSHHIWLPGKRCHLHCRIWAHIHQDPYRLHSVSGTQTHEASARSQAGPLRPDYWQQAPAADSYHALSGSKTASSQARPGQHLPSARKWQRPQTCCNGSNTSFLADCSSTRFPAQLTPVFISTRIFSRPGLT